MRKTVLSLCLVAATAGAIPGRDWSFAFKPMTAKYVIYGSGLGDPSPPSTRDKRVAFVVKGPAALEIFEAIGPDIADECVEKPGRVRRRDNDKLRCTSIGGEYSCRFGFDLVTGQSIGASIC